MKPIWKGIPDIAALNRVSANTIHQSLGIVITEITDDSIVGTMPVDARTHQPMGFLHGGASVVLAESLGSLGTICVLGDTKRQCFGIEISATHLKAVRTGLVTGRARPIQLGAKLHTWDIRLTDEAGDLTCISRLTVYVRAPKP